MAPILGTVLSRYCIGGYMSDETMGREDAAQDAEACAEALESLDRVALGEIAFDDAGADTQGKTDDETQPDDRDADDSVVPAEDEAAHEDSESETDDQPKSDTGEETVLLDSLPAEDSLTRELPGLGSAPAVDETIAMGDIPLPSVPSAHEAGVRHRKMSPKRRNLMVAGAVAVALVAGGAGYAAWNGYRQEQAAITAAEGEKEAAILRADAVKQQRILEAEGEAQAILAVQKANADAIRLLNEAMPSDKVLAIRSLEALAKVANGKATKIIIPSEIQGIAGLAKGVVESVRDD